MALIKINSGERVPVFLLFLMFFSIIAAKITADSVRDTVFLIQFDTSYLPLMYIAIAIVMAGAVAIYKLIASNRDQISLITCSGFVFAASLIAIQPLLTGNVIPCLYVWVEVITVISILQFWILAGEIINNRAAKRLFPLLGVGGSLAGIGAGFSIDPFVQAFGSEKLLFLTTTFIGVSIIAAQFLRPYYALENVSKSNPTAKSDKPTSFGPYIKHIAILIGLSAFVSKIVDYQFKMTAAATYPIQNDLVTYFGSFYMAVGGATLIMQVFLTGFILSRFGILAGMLVLPIAICIGSSGFLLIGSLFAVFIAKFSDQVFKFSTNNAVQEILWLPVIPQKKKKVKPVIDGTIRSGLEGLAGLMIFIFVTAELIPLDKLQWLSIPVIAGVLMWFWNSVRLRDGYVNSLISAIEDRRLNFEDIQYDISDSHVVSTIDKSLNSEDEHTQIFALTLLESLPIDPWRRTVHSLFCSGTQRVKRAALKLSWEDEMTISNRELIENLSSETALTPDLILCGAERKISGLTNTIRPFMSSDDLSVKIVSAVQILEMNPSDVEATKLISDNLQGSDSQALCRTLQFLNKSQFELQTNWLKDWLNHESYEIRNAVLELLSHQSDADLVDRMVQNLESPRTWNNAIVALKNQDESKTLEVFRKYLFEEETTNTQMDGIIRAIPNFNFPFLANDLIEQLSTKTLNLSETISETLLALCRKSQLDSRSIANVDEKIAIFTRQAYGLHFFYSQIHHEKFSQLIIDQINSELKTIVELLLKLGALKKPSIPIETYVMYVQTKDPAFLPLVLEAIDSTFSAINRKTIVPLIDPEQDKTEIAMSIFPELEQGYVEIFNEWITSGQQWKLAIGLQYAIAKKSTSLLDDYDLNRIEKNFGLSVLLNTDEYEYLRQQIGDEYLSEHKEDSLYSLLEKTFFLKTVELFRNIPGDILADIAQISEEIRFEKEHLIFKEGEHGDHMFVVISGNVDIIQNGHVIAELETGSCIGEMALLDQEPRSADAKTTADTVLLQIHQEGFYQLMASNPRIMQEIVKMLTNRIRQLNQRFTAELS